MCSSSPFLLAVALVLTTMPLAAQTIQVTPSEVMIDEPAAITVTGCHPQEHLAIRARLTDGAGVRWLSQSEFIADQEGIIDTAKHPSIAGSYKEISAMGPVWSMKPVDSKEGRYQPPPNFGIQTIDFDAMRGATVISTAQLKQRAIAESVQRFMLRDGRLRGALFVPPGSGRHPAVLVLGGSEGGMPSRRAAWFASHGYAALALAYFRFGDLPRELREIPLEYFGEALLWMLNRPEIDADRIAISGTSRGGELALQLASMYPAIKAVVAYVPANVRYPACCGFRPPQPAWSWQGRGLAFSQLDRDGRPVSDPDSRIAVEHTHGPVLLISGGRDLIWSSSEMTESVVLRLKSSHFSYDVERLNYPLAGHSAGHPEIVPGWQGRVRNPTSGRETEMGGTPQGNAESGLAAAPKVLAFLAKSLNIP